MGISLEPEITDSNTGNGDIWMVTVYDNPYNTFDEVIEILIRATKCSHTEAEMETWEIHNLGKSIVHSGSNEVCQTVADIISSIGVDTEVSQL